jgi:hypothetical protein
VSVSRSRNETCSSTNRPSVFWIVVADADDRIVPSAGVWDAGGSCWPSASARSSWNAPYCVPVVVRERMDADRFHDAVPVDHGR